MPRVKILARSAAALAGLAMLGSCMSEEYGDAPDRKPGEQRAYDLRVPSNAPSMAQLFRAGAPSGGHLGIDITAEKGTPVIAAAGGRVIRAFSGAMYGNQVVIDHGRDAQGRRVHTQYFHLLSGDVDVGQTVTRGQQIGRMGATGVLSGGILHLHFETHLGSAGAHPRPVDPNTLWADGPGRATCLRADMPDTVAAGLTYPVPCL